MGPGLSSSDRWEATNHSLLPFRAWESFKAAGPSSSGQVSFICATLDPFTGGPSQGLDFKRTTVHVGPSHELLWAPASTTSTHDKGHILVICMTHYEKRGNVWLLMPCMALGQSVSTDERGHQKIFLDPTNEYFSCCFYSISFDAINLNSEYNLFLSLLISHKSPNGTLLYLTNWKFRRDEQQGWVKNVKGGKPSVIKINDILIEI